MRKWVLPFLMILSLVFTVPVRAQSPITLSDMQIEIWPEYDKPSVLVIYRMTLSAGTTLPAAMSVRIPAFVGDPNAVAARQADGSLISIDSSRQVSGDWSIISFSTTTPDIQLEYYDPGLAKQGDARHFEYTWFADYAITKLTISVQQPAGASAMRISPSLGSGTVGSDSLTYYIQDIGSVPTGQEINITIDYQKPDDALTATTLPVQPSASIPQSSAADVNLSAWLPWILGIIGAALIVGAIVWFWRTGRQEPAFATRRRRSKSSSPARPTAATSGEGAIYCSQCGKRALPGDQFCRSCGTPIQSK